MSPFFGVHGMASDRPAHGQHRLGGHGQLRLAVFLGFLQAGLHLLTEARDADESRVPAGFFLFVQLTPQSVDAGCLRRCRCLQLFGEQFHSDLRFLPDLLELPCHTFL